MVWCPLSFISLNSERSSILKWAYGINLFSSFRLMTRQFPLSFSLLKTECLKIDPLISSLKKILLSSAFPKFTDPPTLFPHLTLLWLFVLLTVLDKKWKGYSIFELFLRLLGFLSTFSSFLGTPSISLPWVDLKFSEEIEILLVGVFDWILCVIGVLECWEVVSEKIILPPFGITEYYGRVWMMELLLISLLVRNREILFLTSSSAGDVDCSFCWLSTSQNFLDFDFDDNNLATESFSLKVYKACCCFKTL